MSVLYSEDGPTLQGPMLLLGSVLGLQYPHTGAARLQ